MLKVALSALSSTVTSPILYGKSMNKRTQPESTTDSALEIDTTALPLKTNSVIDYEEFTDRSTTSNSDHYSSTSAVPIASSSHQSETSAPNSESTIANVPTTSGFPSADPIASTTEHLSTSSSEVDTNSTSQPPKTVTNDETTTKQSFSTIETTEPDCVEKVWFVPQAENNLTYSVIKQNCADKAFENNATSGYPAFFKSLEEFEQYRKTVSLRKEYIGKNN